MRKHITIWGNTGTNLAPLALKIMVINLILKISITFHVKYDERIVNDSQYTPISKRNWVNGMTTKLHYKMEHVITRMDQYISQMTTCKHSNTIHYKL